MDDTLRKDELLIVRKYQPADTDAIVALFRDTIRRVNIRDYTLEQVVAWAPEHMDSTIWMEKLSTRFSVVAEMAGKLVGFGDFESTGHLDHLFVHADHQHCGIGRSLLSAIEGEAQRQGICRIFTEASITARLFFERHGYRLLEQQQVVCRGVTMTNYRMGKVL